MLSQATTLNYCPKYGVHYTWTPNSFNLTGFHVNPAAPPSFTTYLSSSPSHKDQAIYRLSTQGAWELIANPAATAIKSGEAYWVYCSGASTYQGPLTVHALGGAIDFGKTSAKSSITLTNNTAETRTATITFKPSADWFTYQHFNSGTGYYEYLKLDTKTMQLSAGRQTNLWLAVRRELFTTGQYQGTGILEITDDRGSLIMIPVSAEN